MNGLVRIARHEHGHTSVLHAARAYSQCMSACRIVSMCIAAASQRAVSFHVAIFKSLRTFPFSFSFIGRCHEHQNTEHILSRLLLLLPPLAALCVRERERENTIGTIGTIGAISTCFSQWWRRRHARALCRSTHWMKIPNLKLGDMATLPSPWTQVLADRTRLHASALGVLFQKAESTRE